MMVHYFMFRKIALSLCFTLFLGMLTACNPSSILHPKIGESIFKKSAKNTPPSTEKAHPGTPQIGSPVALPPQFKTANGQNAQTLKDAMPNGLPTLKPMKGINVDTLFSEKIKNTDKRFDRVEGVVADMREEFEVYKPAIVRLSAVESDIQNLIKELEVLLQETPQQPSQPPMKLTNAITPTLAIRQLEPVPSTKKEAPAAVKNPIQKAKPKPVVPKMKKHDGLIAQNLRIGKHAGKTRIVLDTNQNTSFSVDLDNDEKLMIIELPEARWIGKTTKSFPHSAIIDSYTTEPLNGGKGSMLILALKKPTSIMVKKKLSPDSTNAYHRIYFDLKE